MGTEYLSMDTSNYGVGPTEHEVTLRLPGTVETVRGRLSRALEKMGYQVQEEQPLIAKRKAQGGGESFTSSNILDYSTKLHVSLKASGENATLVTFNYLIGHPTMTKADKQVMNREAEAICAWARHTDLIGTCVTCGTEFTTDSRFCRRCGTPAVESTPAEFEVLRLTSKGAMAHDNLLVGLIAIGISLFFLCLPLLPGITLKPKAVILFEILALLGGAVGWVCALNGMRHLREGVHPKEFTEPKDFRRPTEPIQYALPSQTNRLEVNPIVPPSVTESTTELLDDGKSPIPIIRSRDTN